MDESSQSSENQRAGCSQLINPPTGVRSSTLACRPYVPRGMRNLGLKVYELPKGCPFNRVLPSKDRLSIYPPLSPGIDQDLVCNLAILADNTPHNKTRDRRRTSIISSEQERCIPGFVPTLPLSGRQLNHESEFQSYICHQHILPGAGLVRFRVRGTWAFSFLMTAIAYYAYYPALQICVANPSEPERVRRRLNQPIDGFEINLTPFISRNFKLSVPHGERHALLRSLSPHGRA
ncbi:hypothetical protein B0T19DRAFT_186305 [Cercophora scortea]|uniref:Uncharacterized protein n=1 Tax=Cercophora scortea TaxID=314031 RepID=A0AAE0INH3_9PEZI|nr:hypothetical protein B0T19DRAFT_186305 [Cercophora scortea]